MNDQIIIEIEVFGYKNHPIPWEYSSISLTSISGGQFPLCDDEIRVLCDSLAEIVPIKNERWHKLKLRRIYENGGFGFPDECYYEKISIEVLGNSCETCGGVIPIEDFKECEKHGVAPYCSQYCAEIANGVPMPTSMGSLTFDRIFNQNNDGLFNI